VGLNALWNTRLGLAALAYVAAELGSDVPFFVRGGAALMRGRGEELEPLPPLSAQWLILVVPRHELSDKTRRLYAALQSSDFSSGATTETAADRLRRAQSLRESDLVNAFERAARAVFPSLAEIWAAAERIAQRKFFLSGAGPTLFAFAADRSEARQHAASLAQIGAETRAVRTVKHARASVRFAAGSAIGYP
jgi:4-diphosphocytidyl-2-C-methyl-D-erythritol kinase